MISTGISLFVYSVSPVLPFSRESDDSRCRSARTDDYDDYDEPRRRRPFDIIYVDRSHPPGRCSIHVFIFAYSAHVVHVCTCDIHVMCGIHFSVDNVQISNFLSSHCSPRNGKRIFSKARMLHYSIS